MIVIADTSAVLNLCFLHREDLLRSIFQNVVIPTQVADEFLRLADVDERFCGLQIPKWIIVDDAAARTIALKQGFKIFGLLGILLRAKSLGLITELEPEIRKLEEGAGFWIADELRERIITLAGE